MHIRISQLLLLAALAGLAPAGGRAAESTVLADGWRFHLGAAPAGAAAPDYDDSSWRVVRVPHDWAIEGPFEAQGDGDTGRLPWKNEAWYRHAFALPAGDAERRVHIDFDGVMAFPKVYINGHLAGEWDYGYSSFRVDATPFVNWGGDNTIAVHVDTRRWGSRWYPGAGIYRKVTLAITAATHIGHWGIQVETGGAEDPVRPDTATVRTTVDNHRDTPLRVTVRQRLLDPEGRQVAAAESPLDLPARGSAMDTQRLHVADALLWDVEHPHLYRLVTTIERGASEQGAATLDREQTRLGFRHFEFTADDGFHLNGRRVQLYGANLHHDLGPLGAAFNRRAAQRQLEIMQDMGVNALRTAHNPPAPEVLDLADEMGLVVWDEVFDKYAWTAGRPDLQPPLPEFSRRQIDAMVRRDFNHPSVVLWSTGNEVWADEALEGINPERVAMMAGFVRDLDRSRPVGMSCHIPALVDGGNFDALDLTGWNYSRRYAHYRERYPDRPVIYSESASTLSTRGYYDPDLPDRATDYPGSFQMSSYDLGAAPWSDVPDAEFRLMEQDRFVAGEFVWTGFDYLGEPTPFTERARSAYFGAVDLCGFPKDRFYLYRSHWRPDVPTVHLLPHWNWPGRIGGNVPVFVYTNGDSAELFLNGRSLGMRRKGEVPPRLPNLALQGAASASSAAQNLDTSHDRGHDAAAAADGDLSTEWRAQPSAAAAWWQIDLGQAQPVALISVDTPHKENAYAYAIEASADGAQWTRLLHHPTRPYPRWNGPSRIRHAIEPIEVRFLRLVFEQSAGDAPLGLKEFMAFSALVKNDYYDVTYDYRLRWNEVSYEPGELRAVAYQDGQVIGVATVESTGPPAALRLDPDRDMVLANGEDLVFVTTEAIDAEGRPHPLAENQVLFAVEGPAEIAAVGNGNPLSFEPFKADRRQLFYGKALLIVRPLPGSGGTIIVTARSPGLQPATAQIESRALTED